MRRNALSLFRSRRIRCGISVQKRSETLACLYLISGSFALLCPAALNSLYALSQSMKLTPFHGHLTVVEEGVRSAQK